jgi:hypothetical protein
MNEDTAYRGYDGDFNYACKSPSFMAASTTYYWKTNTALGSLNILR